MLITPVELRRLCRASAILRADDEAAPTIAEVARTVAMSPFHFTRRFAAVFGATPHQVRIAARLERARRLLAAGRSVTEVCLAVGFTSIGSFSVLFRARVGLSPSAYRRAARAAVPAPIPGCLGLMGALPAGSLRSAPEELRIGEHVDR